MFFQIVLASLLIILMGSGLCFGGYRFFTILLPISGFFAGFQFGATIFTNLFGQGFLSTIISWMIGLLVGIFAAKGMLPQEFKPAHSVGDLLTQHLDELERGAECKQRW
jgi:hypothetical protein